MLPPRRAANLSAPQYCNHDSLLLHTCPPQALLMVLPAHAANKQQTRDTQNGVTHGTAHCNLHLRGLISTFTEHPLETST